MARRLVTISISIALWVTGALLLVGSAGFLFTAVLHRIGSEGWAMSAMLALGLGAAGALTGGLGGWLVSSGWGATNDEEDLNDTMWLG